MLHTKFCENRRAGSGEEDFCRVFTIYGHGGHLGHVTQTPRTNFRFLLPKEAPYKCFDRTSAVLEKMFEIVNDGRRTSTDDGRTPDHEYPIRSPMSLWLR